VDPKVIIVGLDGASFRVIDPLARAGELPNLSRLMDQGTRGVLTSTIPDITPPSWTSMTTGVNPGKHGIYDFLKIEGNRTRIVTSSDRKSPSVWDILSRNGMRVIVVNVPVTYPPQPVNGIMISDMLTPEGATDVVYPEYLSQALKKRGYKVGIRWAGGGVSKKVGVEELKLHVSERMQTFGWLLDEFEWQFAMVVVNETDFVQHLFPGDAAKISAVYRKADEALGSLLKKLNTETTTLLVVSDHGFNLARRAFRVNDWLVREGAMKTTSPTRRGVVRGLVDFTAKRGTTWRLARAVEKHAPKRALRMTYTSPLIGGALPSGLCCLAPQPHSYVPLFMSGDISDAEYERLLATVARSSETLVDEETGLNPILSVKNKRELYHGVRSIDAPDLTLQMRENYVVSEKMFNSKELFHDTLQGVHEPSGILIAHGRGVKPRAKLESHPTVLEVTPTVLRLLGLSQSRTLDGGVLDELLVSRSKGPRDDSPSSE
jgi:predicted AlkP superfamily phosphohydrolase/phosphomutase